MNTISIQELQRHNSGKSFVFYHRFYDIRCCKKCANIPVCPITGFTSIYVKNCCQILRNTFFQDIIELDKPYFGARYV